MSSSFHAKSYNRPICPPNTYNPAPSRAVVRTTGPIVRDPLAELEAILAEQ